ncbi:MAG TPA: heme o synthase [Actinomycetota bacterium]|nr:heme o synthase [Actinomycetota bacterium]
MLITRSRFRSLALATAIATVVLFAVGGLVRGTGSGLGCSTWPACEPGHLFPSGTVHSLIEFSHRAMAFLVIILTALTGLVAIRVARREPSLFWPAVLAFPLVSAQAALGAVVVATELDAWWVTAHFVAALILIADVTYVAASAVVASAVVANDGIVGGARDEGAVNGNDRSFPRLTLITAALVGLLLLVGTYVRASDAQLVFTDWPLMDGRLVPTLGGAATAMFLHRALAAIAMLLVLWTAIRARTATNRHSPLVRLSTIALALFVVQIMVGAANVWTRLRPWAVVAHVALSVLIWATVVALATVASRLATGRRRTEPNTDEAAAEERPSLRDTVTAYYRLTKPRIVLLLLITTVPAMLLAAGGLPSPWLILATLVGGAVAAGSANSINMYLDRDIDAIMRRTRQRPLPAHAIAPERALRFGFVMGAIAFYFLAVAVNVLAAVLALSAIAFYVFVYTMWLKRTTEQNIVIGGAAGAVPALVGWAAVTGTLAWPAVVLFAIVFVWTPPHFWALAMRFSGDYAAAGVPMLPVVRGKAETRRQILLYSLVLFATTLVLVPVGHMGPVYTGAAVLLGGSFVYRALAVWRTADEARTRRLFSFSILYLAGLFGAVGVDALL